MTVGPTATPHCEGCSRPRDNVEGMFSIRQGGAPFYICFGCLDGLSELANAYRRKWAAEETAVQPRSELVLHEMRSVVDGGIEAASTEA